MKAAPKQNTNAAKQTTETRQSSWQNQSAQVANNSLRAVTQRALIADINHSPRMTAQRQQIESYIGTGQPPIQRLEQPEIQEQQILPGTSAQLQASPPKPNNTGLPDPLKSGIEALSGLSMDNVNVHYNSSQPAQLNALAYAKGTDIHIAPGQEQHLPHEAWHVVQQAQGRVKPTMQMKGGVPVNDDQSLEREADVMGARALQVAGGVHKEIPIPYTNYLSAIPSITGSNAPAQGVWAYGNTSIRLADIGGDPVSYLSQNISQESLFYQNYAAYKQAGGNYDELNNFLNESLKAEQTTALELILNQATEYIQNELSKLNADTDAVDNSDHPEGNGETLPLEPEEIDIDYWKIVDNSWLISFFCDLDVIKKNLNLKDPKENQLASNLYQHWMSSPVMTRNQLNFLTQQGKKLLMQNTGQDPMQMQRGAGITGPKSYIASTVGSYTNVAYTRNENGYFEFNKPTQQTKWKNPVNNRSIVNMQVGCKKLGWGIMKDEKTTVKLQTATRDQHFSIANRIAGIAGSGSPDNYTWHHLETKYEMVLVDRMVHSKHGHNGGIFLWN